VSVPSQGVYCGRDGDDGREEDLERCPESVSCLTSRIATSYDAHNAYADQEETDAEQRENAEAFHGGNLRGHDEGEWNGHKDYVGDDVGNLVGIDPNATNRAIAGIRVDLPGATNRGAARKDCDDGCYECR